MATKRKADKLTSRGSLASALKRRRMAIEDGNLEEASAVFREEMEDKERTKRRRQLGVDE